jgi:hypothetical protein
MITCDTATASSAFSI